jgi:hypothetical protein
MRAWSWTPIEWSGEPKAAATPPRSQSREESDETMVLFQIKDQSYLSAYKAKSKIDEGWGRSSL